MKTSRVFILACLPLLVINFIAVIYDLKWLSNSAELSLYFLLFLGFYSRLDFKNLNISCFLGLSLISVLFNYFREEGVIYFTVMFFQMASYFFLTREAFKFTQREAANRYMLMFFFLMIGTNCYFVFRHFQELGNKMSGLIEFGFYALYYINLLVLVITGLIYYLNSYSRKSVYFITMVMAIVIADILRDMALFYLPDTSVLLLRSFLQFSALFLAIQFFITKEKKLKLINLV